MTDTKNIKNKGLPFPLRVLVTCALLLAVAYALSWTMLFRAPFGGSVTIASMLPVMLIGYFFGFVPGLISGLAFGLLQMTQGVYYVHPVQLVFDYMLAYVLLSLTALFNIKGRKALKEKNHSLLTALNGSKFYRYYSLPLAVLVAGLARFFIHFLSGGIYWASTAPPEFAAQPWLYSLLYNISYMGFDIAICILVISIPQVSSTLRRLTARMAA